MQCKQHGFNPHCLLAHKIALDSAHPIILQVIKLYFVERFKLVNRH